MKRLRRPRFLFVYPLAAALFLAARTSERRLLWGIVIIMLGEAVRLWANGYVGNKKVNWTPQARHDQKIGRLITAGPYSHVRHPLYFGTLLIGIGFCLIVGNLWLGLLALGGFLVTYRRKMAEEEETLAHEWGEEFERYRRAVSRWLPGWRTAPERHGRWTWQGLQASKEPKTLAWVIILLILLYFREELIQNHERLWGTPKHALLVAVLVLLLLGDGLYELWHRRRKRRMAAQPTSSAG